MSQLALTSHDVSSDVLTYEFKLVSYTNTNAGSVPALV